MEKFFILLLLLVGFTMPILLPSGEVYVIESTPVIEPTPTYVPWSPIPTPTRTWE